MQRAPSVIDGARVLRYASVDGLAPTGTARHVVAGEVVTTFSGLAIASYDDGSGYYLFRCDDRWRVVTDTLHDSAEKAMDQARFEFGDVRFVDRAS